MQEQHKIDHQALGETAAPRFGRDWLYEVFQLIRRSVRIQDIAGVTRLRVLLNERLGSNRALLAGEALAVVAREDDHWLDELTQVALRAVKNGDADLADLVELRVQTRFPREKLEGKPSSPELSESVLELLNHIEDVLDDENWDKIDAKLWNAVTSLYAPSALQAVREQDRAENKSFARQVVDPDVVVWMREGADTVQHNFDFERPLAGPWVALGRIRQESAAGETARAGCDGGRCGAGGYCDSCPTQNAEVVVPAAVQDFACYLIDHCEGETVTEEAIQHWLVAASKTSGEKPAERTTPGTPSARLSWLLSELEQRFPGVVDPVSSRPPEGLLLQALDGLFATKAVSGAPTGQGNTEERGQHGT